MKTRTPRSALLVLMLAIAGLLGGSITTYTAAAEPECEEEANHCDLIGGDCQLFGSRSCKETVIGCTNYERCSPE